jgi:hypothetical protein
MSPQKKIYLHLILTSTLLAGTYSGGNGTTVPYVIHDLDDLAELAQTPADWDKKFQQDAHIDASATQYWDDADEWHAVNATSSPDGDKYNDPNDANSNGNNEGFPGIGTDMSSFSGTYDGNNFTISNLTINRGSTNYVGFFRSLNRAEIDDITFSNLDVIGNDYVGGLVGEQYGATSAVHNCDPEGTISGNNYVGGVVGQNNRGTVKFCVNSATVNGSGTDVGGVVGHNYDGGSVTALVHDCLNTGTVTGSSDAVGGIVGKNTNSSTIRQCYNTGTISGAGEVGGVLGKNGSSGVLETSYNSGSVFGTGDWVGGLAGYNLNGSIIRNCFNTGSVTGTGSGTLRFGGLVGVNTGQISNCYSTGAVTGSSQMGGLVYYTTGGTVENCFWLTGSAASSPGGGTEKTNSEMKDYTTFTDAGWDFVSETANGSNNYWDADQTGTVNSGYPILAWQSGADQSLPVTLSGFKARSDYGSVQLEWRTSSEVENLGFILERAAVEKGPYMEIASYLTHEMLMGQGSSTDLHDYRFVDKNVVVGQTYHYCLSDVSYQGKVTTLTSVDVVVKDGETTVQPESVQILKAFPNPFNPVTTISYKLVRPAAVKLTISDLRGREIVTLLDEQQSAGQHEVTFNLSNSEQANLGSGVYIARIVAGNYAQVIKLTVLR